MNFFSIPAVSIAISIVICWALFAILCSLVHEAMAQIKAERGRFMKYYLLKQFQDLPNGINWGETIYQQGNVSLLSRDERKPSVFAQKETGFTAKPAVNPDVFSERARFSDQTAHQTQSGSA